ncbi:glycine betaine ABC transporter substrate-binding protein [Jonesia denitrificans]|uniref:Substrate-binding region of ABC-type glycine betaine transport system n=1 Tax=Jonesia denitrificans (strain ATCC 14870 / DSM 20603 / BCRC 15368 / CIP 55.134 / JCM 11481 / NBRC 15587 / NCTC 10816 / Prevot 55134) TaxID=471856 RepID=C7R5I4_JONDD|nr:glycine betaine ABC transporter substrate-binding protein [Jonesia denitrificans]ACV09257.1 Substrate-binding region of ABC-type glycine betaine transport system [Jonesia denitrificans DSM 20603]ASE09475.1 glycine/betaine ABC transporter substrate-binding protein [Jonesia denitrificans]QXB44022.1 glycine betaine ABC transporter substrate-binding protein [Jonesia denitrificans]SQH21495.1 Glycine betaine-binding protein precursor [Jonesia denitrificans]
MMKKTASLAAVLAGGLVLASCSSDGGDTSQGDAGENKDLSIAVFNGWDEGIATSELWAAVLADEGYNVTLDYADAAPVFVGLSTGDYDFTTDVWLPGTHKEYVEEYGDQIEDLGSWFDQAKLTIAVNEDAPITSLAELADNADAFGNQIVGIEPAAGLTSATENEVIPTYGLEGMDFTTSSTVAMLSELKAATDAGENVVVTLWEPHWAYSAFPVRNLEDPEGALGGAELIHSYGRDGFAEDFPEVAQWLGDFSMDPELLYDLEDLLFNENDTDDYEPLVRQWMEENQEFVDSMTS